MNCFVCNGLLAGASNEHHVVPQSRGGTDGPTVMLCPTCHTLLHNIAKKMIGGKDASHMYAHLTPIGQDRILGLVQIILIAEGEDKQNPHPLIMVALDDPVYMTALKLYQKDCGFSSQDRAVNAIFRAIAIKYNLIKNVVPPVKRGKIPLSRMESRG